MPGRGVRVAARYAGKAFGVLEPRQFAAELVRPISPPSCSRQTGTRGRQASGLMPPWRMRVDQVAHGESFPGPQRQPCRAGLQRSALSLRARLGSASRSAGVDLDGLRGKLSTMGQFSAARSCPSHSPGCADGAPRPAVSPNKAAMPGIGIVHVAAHVVQLLFQHFLVSGIRRCWAASSRPAQAHRTLFTGISAWRLGGPEVQPPYCGAWPMRYSRLAHPFHSRRDKVGNSSAACASQAYVSLRFAMLSR